MRKLKRFLAAAGVAAAMISVTGCGNSGASGTKETTTAPARAETAESQTIKEESGYPTKSVTIINPFGAGGGTDIAIRKLASMVEKDLGQTIVVVNKTGGSGAVGSAEAANAAPDGYTFLTNDKSLLASYFMGVSQTKWSDMDSVCSLVKANYVIVTGASSGYETLDDLINAAKEAPETLSIGVSGIGGMSHLVAAQFLDKAQVSIKVIGFDGGSEVKAAVTGNQVACASLQLAEIMPLVESGDVKILGVVQGDRRSEEGLKDFPTLKEQGIDCTLDQNWFLWAPKGTDPEIIEKMSQLFQKAVESEEFKNFMEENYYTGSWKSPEDTAKELEMQDEILKEIVEGAGLSQN